MKTTQQIAGTEYEVDKWSVKGSSGRVYRTKTWGVTVAGEVLAEGHFTRKAAVAAAEMVLETRAS